MNPNFMNRPNAAMMWKYLIEIWCKEHGLDIDIDVTPVAGHEEEKFLA